MYRGAIVGFGPAGMGPLVAAARTGTLRKWLRDGVVVLDSGSRPGFGKFGEYLITANTSAEYTIDPFRPKPAMTPVAGELDLLGAEDPIMGQIRALPTYKVLDKLSQEGVHVKGTLGQYGAFCEEVATLFVDRIEQSGTSKYFANTTVEKLQLHHPNPGSPLHISGTSTNGTHVAVDAKSAVIATGGRPKLPSFSAELNSKIRSSDYVQRKTGMGEVEALVKSKQGQGKGPVKVAIIGGSHSAFSSTKLLLDMLGNDVSVAMLLREPIKVFHDSVADAENEGESVQPNMVCQFTGQVNKYGGIRAPVKELYLASKRGQEERLQMVEAAAGTPSESRFFAILEEADLVVSAFGYVANWPSLLDPKGTPMEWALDPVDGQALMNNSTCQVGVSMPVSGMGMEAAAANGGKTTAVELPNVFGIGLGYGVQNETGGDASKRIGEPNVRIDGSAQYHSWVGLMVLNGMSSNTKDNSPLLGSIPNVLLCAVLTRAWLDRAGLSPSNWPSRGQREAAGGATDDVVRQAAASVILGWTPERQGRLGVGELSDALQSMGISSSSKQIHELISALDADDKNYIDAADLSRHIEGMDAEALETAVALVFAGIDLDGDGWISPQELQAHVGRFHNRFLTSHECLLLLQSIGGKGRAADPFVMHGVDLEGFRQLLPLGGHAANGATTHYEAML